MNRDTARNGLLNHSDVHDGLAMPGGLGPELAGEHALWQAARLRLPEAEAYNPKKSPCQRLNRPLRPWPILYLYRGELHEHNHSLVWPEPCALNRVPLRFLPFGIVVAICEFFSGRRTDQHIVLFKPHNPGCASECRLSNQNARPDHDGGGAVVRRLQALPGAVGQ